MFIVRPSGQSVVEETIQRMKQNWVKNGVEFDMKELCHRYAHAVTQFGTKQRDGYYGIWNLNKNEIGKVLKVHRNIFKQIITKLFRMSIHVVYGVQARIMTTLRVVIWIRMH